MKKTIIFLLLTIIGVELSAQYFGRNKPRYRNFNFKVYQTPHFDLHHYSKNQDMVDWFAQDMEQWYDFHGSVLSHDIPFKNPFILYNNHAEFQQTNAISGGIGVGTGGVTEALKNRVIMPLTFSNQQTHQVLGHELVHAFQFNMILGGDSTNIQSLSNLPLWTVEGMAEYMSIGRVDPFTAMWMRNAILNDDVPSLQKMANPKYFPYRYGQAAWSFFTGYYGDNVIEPFFMKTAMYGMEYASQDVFGVPLETLSSFWENSLKHYYEDYLGEGKESRIGKTLLSKENSGKLNVSPAISPNGRYVVYMSEKDLFSTDIFLADARNGEILRKLSSLVKDRDLDNFNFLESAGTWASDNKRFAFVGFSKGKNTLVIKNTENGSTIETHEIPGVAAFTNPNWRPQSSEIVVTGNVEGQIDLYVYNIKTKKVKQLTDDVYSEVQTHFNSTGDQIAFSYDKRSFTEGRTNGMYTYDLAIMDYESGEIEILDIFHGANNINPSYDHEDNIYFMSDGDGYRNMYRYIPETGEVLRMTDFLTGLSGISRFSPVLTAARTRDRVLFTHYYGNEYTIKSGNVERLLNEPVDKTMVDFAAGTLPMVGMGKTDIVNDRFGRIDKIDYVSTSTFKDVKYKPNFKLDYIGGSAGVGVTNSTFGNYTGLQGGIDLLFGDVLGNHQIFSQVALNGEIYDFGARINYINRSNQLAWGFGVSHVPTRFGAYGQSTLEEVPIGNNQSVTSIVDRLNIIRIFDKSATVFAHLPFSTTLRLEGSADIGHRGFRWDETKFYSQAIPIGNGNFARGGFFGEERNKLETGDEIQFNQFYTLTKGLVGTANIALVGDNSYFGLTSPLYGDRFRLSVEKSYGVDDYVGFLGDYRKYFWMKPFSFAIRGLGYVRYEQEVNSVYPLYIGQMGFVRGYDFFDAGEDLYLEQLLGSKMGLISAEIRMPFTGPKQLALIGSNVLFTDLALFFDAGVAFNEFSHLSDGEPLLVEVENPDGSIGYETQNIKPAIAKSVGLSVRVNLFGAMIIEPYWAYPLQKDSQVRFGLNFIPGW